MCGNIRHLFRGAIKKTKLYDGKRRILISHGKFNSYGSELKDSKYPIVDNNWFEIITTASEYSGSAVRNLNVPYEKVEKILRLGFEKTILLRYRD